MKKIIFILLIWCPVTFGAASLTENSFDGVVVGESASSALKKLPGYFEEKLEEAGSCYYLSAPKGMSGASFMVLDEIVVRIEVYNKDQKVQTNKGITIGSKKSEVLKKYKKVKVSPHPYTAPEGEYLEVKLSNGLGIIFETNKDVVTEFRLGSYPAIEYIEGCL